MALSSLEGMTLGKYRVLEALGRGGMAQVYKAYHPQLDRYMAIKVLRSDLVEQDDFLKRFQREAHAVSGLRHPNIVQVVDFDQQDDLYYMVMELLEGDTLRAHLNSYRVHNQRIPLPEATKILKDILNALSFAHGEGVIHRDIKPANIMLTKKSDAVLTDFGIAQIVGNTQYTVSGALMGTLNYMAPEQGLKGTCDERSDIYSLGIVMYEMLTGYTPFDADTPLAILMKHLNNPLPLPSQVDPTIPEALEKIVLKCLAKDPDTRFQSAEEVASAINQIEKNLVPEKRPAISPPSEFAQGAVFSGSSRQKINDHRFADADTDSGIQLNTSQNSIETFSVLNLILKQLTTALRRIHIPAISVGSSVFGGLILFLIINMIAVMVATFSGHSIFKFAWPIELFLIANFLAMVCWGSQTHGLMIPTGIFFGNALIFTYCTLTGRWGDWAFLWMVELLFLFIAIALPIRVMELPDVEEVWPDVEEVWARTHGLFMAIACVSLSLATIVLSYLIT